jgi:hypothetical protein
MVESFQSKKSPHKAGEMLPSTGNALAQAACWYTT